MNIRTEADTTGYAPRDCRYSAIDSETYDGAPDSRNRWHVGYGATPAEAEADLRRLLDEIAEMEDERLHEAEVPDARDTP
jgi:hypothetical protein